MNIFLWNVWGLLYRWIKGVKVDTLLCPLEVLKILWKPENVVPAKCHTRISNQYINQIGKWPIKCLNSLCQGSADFSIIWFDNEIWPRILFWGYVWKNTKIDRSHVTDFELISKSLKNGHDSWKIFLEPEGHFRTLIDPEILNP